jgi:hypothetical protein
MLQLPIKGLTARKGNHFVKFGSNAQTPWEVWHGDRWVASFTTRAKAVAEMTYRFGLDVDLDWWK